MVQTSLDVEVIKQYPGRVQVERKVKLRVPGKHFPQLTPAEQKDFYDGTAVEYAERHKFERHLRASWGVAHTGPGIRFICDSDAFDDPDTRGFWTSLALWNRWRHATFKDNREAEKEYLDELPAAAQRPRRRRRKRRRRPRSIQRVLRADLDRHAHGRRDGQDGGQGGHPEPLDASPPSHTP
jgi:hypothetical protein